MISGVDCRPGVGWSVRNGTGEVVTRVVAGSGYGCGYPAASGRLLNDHEFGRPRQRPKKPYFPGTND